MEPLSRIGCKTLYPKRCKECIAQSRAEEQHKEVRKLRMANAARMRQALDFLLPPLFRKAHMRDLSKGFRLALDTRKSEQGLLLWGTPGTGKSHAMAAIIRQMRLKGYSCQRISYEKLCLAIRGTFSQNSKKSELDIITPFISVDCLFIEDLGATVSEGRQESDFSLRTFLVILDSRLEATKPTFITTNKSVESLASSFDERIASRLSTFKIIKVPGRDKRRPL